MKGDPPHDPNPQPLPFYPDSPFYGPSKDRADAESDNEHDAKMYKAHAHGRQSFLKLLWLAITGQGDEDEDV